MTWTKKIPCDHDDRFHCNRSGTTDYRILVSVSEDMTWRSGETGEHMIPSSSGNLTDEPISRAALSETCSDLEDELQVVRRELQVAQGDREKADRAVRQLLKSDKYLRCELAWNIDNCLRAESRMARATELLRGLPARLDHEELDGMGNEVNDVIAILMGEL